MTNHSGNHVCGECPPPHQHSPDDQGLCACGVDCSPGPHVAPTRSPELLADEALGAEVRRLRGLGMPDSTFGYAVRVTLDAAAIRAEPEQTKMSDAMQSECKRCGGRGTVPGPCPVAMCAEDHGVMDCPKCRPGGAS